LIANLSVVVAKVTVPCKCLEQVAAVVVFLEEKNHRREIALAARRAALLRVKVSDLPIASSSFSTRIIVVRKCGTLIGLLS